MQTALLIDETNDPIGLRLDPRDFDRSKPYLTWGVMGQAPRSFKFVRADGELMLFRLATGSVSDAHFDHVAQVESDKFLHPEKYFDRVLYPEMFRRPGLPQTGQRIPNK